MVARRFQQVDVFTVEPLFGNPVAVVLDGEGLTDDEMQALARWTNLSETTFVSPPTDATADYAIRIFTPGGELGFAGHPTLGTAHAWRRAGGTPRGDQIVQQGKVGLVRIRTTEPLAFAAPASVRSDPEPAVLEATLAALGLRPGEITGAQLLDNGTDWLALLVPDAATVLGLQPDHAALGSLPKTGVVGWHPDPADSTIEVRAFADSVGIAEDPITGSLQASVAQWLLDLGRVSDRYRAAQGTCIGRRGRVEVERVGADVWIGGGTHTLIEGTVDL